MVAAIIYFLILLRSMDLGTEVVGGVAYGSSFKAISEFALRGHAELTTMQWFMDMRLSCCRVVVVVTT